MSDVSNIEINGTSYVVKDASAARRNVYYGTCTTAANTYKKVATVETFPLDSNNKPLVGTVVAIKYSYTNTYKTEGQTYQLNVNSTGDYPMYYNNAALATSTSANTLVAGYKNRHIFYMFNGSQWVWVTSSYDANTTYSGMTQAEVDAGTGTTARLITPQRLRDNFYTEDEVDALLGAKANSADLAAVATSGSYNDLTNKPTIPTSSDINAVKTLIVNIARNVSGSNITYSADTTVADINSAVKAGRAVVAKISNSYYQLHYCNEVNENSEIEGEFFAATAVNTPDIIYTLSFYSYRDTTSDPWEDSWEFNMLEEVTPDWNITNQFTRGYIKNKPTIPTAATSAPLMDGTAAVGSSSKYAKEDHVHPSDTSKMSTSHAANAITSTDITNWNNKQSALVSGTNIKTINNQSLLGSGNLTLATLTDVRDSMVILMHKNNNKYYRADGSHQSGGSTTWVYSLTELEPDENHTYVDIDTNKIYRWTTSGWSELSVPDLSGKANIGGSATNLFTAQGLYVTSYNDSTTGINIDAAYNSSTQEDTLEISASNGSLNYTFNGNSEEIATKSDLSTPIVTVSTTGAVTQALDPNKFYDFTGSPTSLTLTLSSGNDLCIYAGKFTAGTGFSNLTFPSTVKVADGAPSVEAGGVYEFSVMNNLLLLAKEGS